MQQNMRKTLFLMVGLALLSGCAASRNERAKVTPPYEPQNIYALRLPEGFLRVAVLPLAADPALGGHESLEAIELAVREELFKTKQFEFIVLSADTLREVAGVSSLRAIDVWPQRLKQALQERQIDGVLALELTQLKGFPPISLGLRMRLVGVQTGLTYWACEELFDMAAPEVFAGAKRFEEGMLMQMTSGKIKNPGTMELSPSKLAKYAAYTLFATLPPSTTKRP